MIALLLFPLVLLGLGVAVKADINDPPAYLYPGCVQTGCGSSGCPAGLVQHWASMIDSRATKCGARTSFVCCPFPTRNVQWTPIDLVEAHVCPKADPCPSLNKILIYADVYGRDSKMCYTGNFYMCEDKVVASEVKTYKSWSSQGCYSDSANARSLPNVFSASGMTVAKCLDAAAGFKYAGVEYGRECYFGNYLASSASRQSGCNMACEGSPSELCGAGNLMNLYLNSAYSQPATEKQSVGNWRSQGCHTDSASARGLSGGASTRADMTVEMCVGLAAGFKYAAVEYGTECYWGNSLNAASVPASGQCTMACGGDGKTLCGDGNRMNLYINSGFQEAVTVPTVGSFSYIGCFVDDPASRILPNQNNDATLTVERCVALAAAAGARYAGVENGNQCFFGTVLTAPTADGCTKSCVGNLSQLCGGARRMGVYENRSYTATSTIRTTLTTQTTTSRVISSQTSAPATALVTPTTTRTVSTSIRITSTAETATATTIATTTTTATLAIETDGSIGTFFNRGCFFDQERPRVLAADSRELRGSMTVGECVQFARQGLWRYAGVEFGYQCYVGNTLRDATSSNQLDCSQPCDGDASQACGAGNRILVYEDFTWVDPTAPMLVAVLTTYHNAMSRARAVVETYQTHIRQIQSLATRRSARGAALLESRQSLNDLLRQIGLDASDLRAVQDLLESASRICNDLFRMASGRDIDMTGAALVDTEQIELLSKATRETGEALSRVSSAAGSVAAEIAGGATAGSLNLGTSLSAITSGLNTIGSLGSAGAATATGAVLSIVVLLQAFGGLIGGGGGAESPENSATVTSTSAAECTISPTGSR